MPSLDRAGHVLVEYVNCERECERLRADNERLAAENNDMRRQLNGRASDLRTIEILREQLAEARSEREMYKANMEQAAADNRSHQRRYARLRSYAECWLRCLHQAHDAIDELHPNPTYHALTADRDAWRARAEAAEAFRASVPWQTLEWFAIQCAGDIPNEDDYLDWLMAYQPDNQQVVYVINAHPAGGAE